MKLTKQINCVIDAKQHKSIIHVYLILPILKLNFYVKSIINNVISSVVINNVNILNNRIFA